MICEDCGQKNATLHFTKIVNGEKTEFHICESCARERGDFIPGTPNGFSIHNLLSGLLDFDPAPSASNALGKTQKVLRCENCGLTYTQFGKLGRFGCSSCYRYFSDRLDSVFKRVHGNTVHVGKIPKRSGGIIQHKREIEQLKRQLQQCIQNEAFEEAAKIRDQIRALEKQIAGENESVDKSKGV